MENLYCLYVKIKLFSVLIDFLDELSIYIVFLNVQGVRPGPQQLAAVRQHELQKAGGRGGRGEAAPQRGASLVGAGVLFTDISNLNIWVAVSKTFVLSLIYLKS